MKKLLVLLILSLFLSHTPFTQTKLHKYYPVESELVQQNLDDWQDRKFGLFMHWGTYSQWGIVESWAICGEDEPWCIRDNPSYEAFKKDYTDLQSTFNPSLFNPELWAEAAQQAGMKYMVFTTKHHDGFNMFDTQYSDYKITSPNCPFHENPKADVTKEIFSAFRNKNFMIGAYYSKPDWNSEYFWWPNFPTPDRNVNYKINKYPDRWEKFVEFSHNQIDELMSNYGKVDILWMDGGWVRPLTKSQTWLIRKIEKLFLKAGYTQLNPPQNQDMRISEMAEKARKKQPGLIVVDRHIVGPNENYLTPEQTIPNKFYDVPWESCITLSSSWSYSPHAKYKSSNEVIHLFLDIISKNGNLLLNVGPKPDGTWDETSYERLKEIGNWMNVNAKAIYGTTGRKKFGQNNERYTVNKDGTVNAFWLVNDTQEIPETITFHQWKLNRKQQIKLLGYNGVPKWEKSGNRITVILNKEIREQFKDSPALTFIVETNPG